jgi:hypothetical protein
MYYLNSFFDINIDPEQEFDYLVPENKRDKGTLTFLQKLGYGKVVDLFVKETSFSGIKKVLKLRVLK